MGMVKKQATFSENVAKLILYIISKNYGVTLGEAYRTPEQAKIYAAQGKGIAHSLHCERLAIDLNLFSPEGTYLTDAKHYEQFGVYWESLHQSNRWGGRFKKLVDANHFEMNV